MEKQIQAKLISQNKIEVTLSRGFYNGESDKFFLKTDEGFSEKLEIKKIKATKKAVVYQLQSKQMTLPNYYYISECHNLKADLDTSSYVRTNEFKKKYYYDKDDLGYTYTKEHTTFKVYSPLASEVILKIEDNGLNRNIHMTYDPCGVYSCRVSGNLELAQYSYLAKIDGVWREAVDPYAYSATPNGIKSVVIDINKCVVNKNRDKLKEFKKNVDAIIYELHIRDFSSGDSPIKNKGKFIAFLEKGLKMDGKSVGIDYLQSLGVTHIQLLPFYDFGSVDELNQWEMYNWGYDPMLYSIPEGSYASDVHNGYSRVMDCMNMISSIHRHGMRVNMDVVYNHMFSKDASAFEKLCPNYFFRVDSKGKVSNGSYCGNDFDSLMPMARKYIVESCLRWVKMYDVDGFRFDLMGIIDIDTMNEVYDKCSKVKPDIMIYGEGWSMPTLMDATLASTQVNNKRLPNIGFFSDRFRDILRGNNFDGAVGGYLSRNRNHRIYNIDVVKDSILGEVKPVSYGYNYLSCNNVVNYVECHDNQTVFDKLKEIDSSDSLAQIKERCKLALAMVLVSQGIPFIHAGEEFIRTKGGMDNSYNSSDEVNKLDYHRMIENYDMVEYFKALVELRKNTPSMRLTTQNEIEDKTSIVNDNDVIFYRLKEEKMLIVFNPNYEDYYLNHSHKVILDSNALSGYTTNKVKGLSCCIFVEEENEK